MVQLRKVLLTIIFLTGFILKIAAQDNAIINKISFTGIDTLGKETLLKQMNTKARPFTGKMTFWKKSARFSSFTFEEDILKLKKYYQQNGFLDASIPYDIVPNKNNKKVNITIHIKKGNPVLIGEIKYLMQKNTETKKILDSITTIIPIQPGMLFQDEKIIAAEKLIREKFSKKGYPLVKVEKNIFLNEKLRVANINFTINTGNKSYFGRINLKGITLIDSTYIRKHIEIKKGDNFSQVKIEKTQEELFDMNLFRYVTIRAMMDSVEQDAIPISIHIKELPRWSLKVGAGYGTEDKVRTSILLKRLNFLGGGRTLIIKGEQSYFTPLSIESKFIQPDIWTKNLDLILNPYFSREREDSYKVDRLGTSVTLQKELSKKSAAYISYTFGKDNVDLSKSKSSLSIEEADKLNHNKSGITFGYNKNTTNDIFSPTKGWKYEGTLTYMGIGFNSQFHYYKIMTEIDYFQKLGKNVVFAGKLKTGVINPTQGDSQTPIEDRFLMGGALSLRGWGRNQISPINESGSKLGGNSMLESSAELRFPLYGIFSGTAFADLGNSWFNPWEFKPNQLNYDAGLGLRVKTPVGPIRVDVASPLFEGKFETQFFITIGHAF
ncbi:outer membrane protein assembly factor BamA [Labilibaculum filiforme]|uniref:Outer membrane protein assembly factor BamA n=1 Tax=Labilibaculum filiforme TaxID=1940526 RepID=A0A2N3HUK2_9BACT|nr:outer membrane protein assembly factor BamA [Labilibaculum filiforme]PKQ61723.1 outer membrane protein assembly factor BamA [Labilibaculum filiforme]